MPAEVTWTKKDLETLMAMWVEARSYSEIAKELKRSKNAISGKINRLGLSRSASAMRATNQASSKREARKNPPSKRVSRPAVKKPTTGTSKKSDKILGIDDKVWPFITPPNDLTYTRVITHQSSQVFNAFTLFGEFQLKDEPGPTPFKDLKDTQCSFILDDAFETSGPMSLCCGKTVDLKHSYCAAHRLVIGTQLRAMMKHPDISDGLLTGIQKCD